MRSAEASISRRKARENAAPTRWRPSHPRKTDSQNSFGFAVSQHSRMAPFRERVPAPCGANLRPPALPRPTARFGDGRTKSL